MANLDMNDLMAIRGVDRYDDDRRYGYGRGYYGDYGHGSMSPYEQVKTAQMLSKRPSGVAVAGLTVGSAAALAAIGAWIFGGMQASAKSKEAAQIGLAAKEQAALQFQSSTKLLDTVRDDTQRTIDRILTGLRREEDARVNGDQTITQTITDTVSGSQQGTLSQAQQAELSQAQQLMFGLSTGEYSRNPQRVALYRDATPCPCPAGGCNCGMQ